MADSTDDRATSKDRREKPTATATPPHVARPSDQNPVDQKVEIGGPKGPEPTRYGDWEKGGRCIDF
jgi:hypothetical protein